MIVHTQIISYYYVFIYYTILCQMLTLRSGGGGAKTFPSACCTAHAIAVTTVTELMCVCVCVYVYDDTRNATTTVAKVYILYMCIVYNILHPLFLTTPNNAHANWILARVIFRITFGIIVHERPLLRIPTYSIVCLYLHTYIYKHVCSILLYCICT